MADEQDIINIYPLGVAQSQALLEEENKMRQIVYSLLDNYDRPIAYGNNNETFKVSASGIHLGHADFSSAPFSVSMTGALVATSATISGSITATSGAIGGFNIGTDYIRDAANSFGLASTVSGSDDVRFWAGDTFANRATAPFRVTEAGVVTVGASNGVVIDGPNSRIGSSNYVAATTGWRANGDGSAEFGDVRIRGTISASVLEKSVASVVGGELIVANGDALATAMTALDASTLTIEGTTTFAVNDILYFKNVTDEEYLRVTSIASAPTYLVTRDLLGAYSANNNPAWAAGTAVMKKGKSDGAAVYSGGYLRLLGEGTNSPRYGVFKRTGIAANSITEIAGFGNLNGLIDYVAEEYGVAIGSASAFMTYDQTNGLRITGAASVNGSTLGFQNIYGDGSDGTVVISGDTTLTRDMFYENLTIDPTFTLNTGGFRVHVKTLLTVNGTIGRPGVAGGAGGAGGSTGAAGTAGTSGTALADGSVKGAVAGPAGIAGSAGQARNSSGKLDGVDGTVGTAGTAVAKSLTEANGSAGGASARGGSYNYTSGTVNPGVGKNGGAAASYSGTVFNKPRTAFASWLLQDFFPSNDSLKSSAGSGSGAGGAGGGCSRDSGGSDFVYGGGGGGGGGAGSPGGICPIYAKRIVIGAAGVITVRGGAGGAGGAGGTGTLASVGSAGAGGGGGGGGAGGSGGALVLVYSSISNSGSILYTGGTGGAGGAAGANVGSHITGGETQPSAGVAGTDGVTGGYFPLVV
jgi:hypothetical protein